MNHLIKKLEYLLLCPIISGMICFHCQILLLHLFVQCKWGLKVSTQKSSVELFLWMQNCCSRTRSFINFQNVVNNIEKSKIVNSEIGWCQHSLHSCAQDTQFVTPPYFYLEWWLVSIISCNFHSVKQFSFTVFTVWIKIISNLLPNLLPIYFQNIALVSWSHFTFHVQLPWQLIILWGAKIMTSVYYLATWGCSISFMASYLSLLKNKQCFKIF